MNIAQKACKHALDRVIIDRNFSWLMWGTESMLLMMQSEAQRRGVSVETVQSEIGQKQKAYDAEMIRTDRSERTKTEVLELRKRVEELECRISDLTGKEDDCQCLVEARELHESDADDAEALCRVKQLCNDAALGLVTLTTDRLQDAIDGSFVMYWDGASQ